MTTTMERNGCVPGQCVPIVHRRAKEEPWPDHGTPSGKISHLVGSCHVCPSFQAAG